MASPVQHDATSDTEPVASPSQVEDHDVVMSDLETLNPDTESHSKPSDKRLTKPRRVKTPTYMVRKKEKTFLLEELDMLQAQLKQLQRQATINAAKAEHERTNLPRELSTEFLTGASQQQQLSLVNIQSALSGYVVRTYLLKLQLHVPGLFCF